MPNQLAELVRRWLESGSADSRAIPEPEAIEAAFAGFGKPTRPGADPRDISAWEGRHGFRLPDGLRHWLSLSNGLYRKGPLIHPISAIGPMVPWARIPGMFVQPESWFELGNPNVETICIDLGYQWPGGGNSIFTSGDDDAGTPPRIIATSFEDWFLELFHRGGEEYWFDPGFTHLGDPWEAHCRHTPRPPLPDRLSRLAERTRSMARDDPDERAIARELGITRPDVELLLRHIQHQPSASSGA